MTDQSAFLWPGADEPCPKCKGTGEVYYLHAKHPGADVLGGKRIMCSACGGTGNVGVPVPDPPPMHGR